MPSVPSTSTCSDCGKTRSGRLRRGRCSTCYKRLLAAGDRTRSVIRGVTPEERLWMKVDSSGGPEACWPISVEGVPNGYCHIKVGDRSVLAHRFAYECAVGPIPEGEQIDHVCHDPATCLVDRAEDCPHRRCCNPAHLRPASARENTLRGATLQADNAGKTHCPQGHPYDEENTRERRGRRHCKECERKRWQEWHARRVAAGWEPDQSLQFCPRCTQPRRAGEFRAGICGACRVARKRAVERGEDPERAYGGPAVVGYCKRGHPFDAENTRFVKRPDGSIKQRQCRECEREAWRARHPSNAPAGVEPEGARG